MIKGNSWCMQVLHWDQLPCKMKKKNSSALGNINLHKSNWTIN